MKVLVIQQKMIGDVLTSSILFEPLRKEYPTAELHYLIYPNTRAVVENNPYIDKIIEFNPDWNINIVGFFRFLRRIEATSYDIVIDAYSKIGTGIIAKFSGATTRISFHKEYTRQFYTHTFKYKNHPETKAGLAIENRMLLLQALNKDFPVASKPVIYISDEEKLQVENKLQTAGLSPEYPIIMCGILGSTKIKSYPAPYMATVLDEIVRVVDNAQILFNYIPSQKVEARKIFSLCAETTKKRIFNDIYEKDLRKFILNCTFSEVYIGNEGGAANIAKALSIPTFSLYSPFIKKQDWAIYEDGIRNKSIHPEDFSTQVPGSYKNLKPENFRNELRNFLLKNIRRKIQKSS
ncbi:glycosyltransferase family 9 protein [Salinimicrobium terrae]|uniref:glycosyltransferase family 9 protein n=1 Tax=Salinimicrobium terrae TaxID=470866 RepID=UPI0003FA97A7|nr:glycosyltransferase family 9 protein [Salinimicrobium terrae]